MCLSWCRESDEADAQLLIEHRRRLDEEERKRAERLKVRQRRGSQTFRSHRLAEQAIGVGAAPRDIPALVGGRKTGSLGRKVTLKTNFPT